jgi:hypothetical protein
MNSINQSEKIATSLGFFGNIWVHQNELPNIGSTNGNGHYHKYDHISLLTKGSVRVEVEGHESQVFTAPTFIVIRKNKKHKFTALEPETIYFCVFALRDLDGQVITDEDVLFGAKHDPLSARIVDNTYHDNMARLLELTQHETDNSEYNVT